MRNCIIWLLFAYIVIFGHPLLAQSSVQKVHLPKLGADITIKVPHFVGVGEQFRLIFSCNKDLTNFEIESSDSLTLLLGPSKSITTSVKVVNGTTQTEKRFDYTYIYESKQSGKFRVPSIIFRDNGESTDALPLYIKVENRPVKTKDSSNDTVFVRPVLDKEQIQLGDSTSLTFKIYASTSSLNLNSYYFDFPYCYIEEKEVTEDSKQQWEVETYEKLSYYTYIFRKFLLTPLQHGDIQIPKAEFEFTLQADTNADPFEAFFGNPEYKKEIVYIAPITIKVTP